MGNFQKTWNGIKEGWNGIGRQKRASLVILLILIASTVIGLTYYTQKVEYATLFSNLEETDAGVIVNDLKTKKVKYKLEENGTTILVDKNQVDTYRIDLAVNDMLPQNSTGFEIFDTTSMMATDEDRKIMYQRAVTGELERSISALDSIETAKVLLSMPKESVFTSQEDKSKASASVVLTTSNGKIPDSSAVQGIASLIAGAVENLPKENIKIVDTKGNLLSAALEDDASLNATDMVSKYQAIKNRYEQELEEKLIDTLGPIFGTENVNVAVSADLNFDSVQKENVTYSDEPVLRSETVSASGGTIDVAGGIGTDNVVNEIIEGEGGVSSSYDRTANYELDTETTSTAKAPGSLNQLSTSIILNKTLSKAEEDQVQEIVKMTIGFAEDREDQLTVQGMEFTKGPEDVVPTTPKEIIGNTIRATLLRDWPYLAGGLGILLLLMILMMVFLRKSKDDTDDELDFEETIINTSASDLTNELEMNKMKKLKEKQEKLAKRERMERNDREAAELTEELNQAMSVKEKAAREFARDNPEASADLIKIWMRDE
ncbi:flagellar M-ring protein FliF [Carnobacterium iners]|uniref:Flagellar M-ring protein n=1 Tax=Carnobacterium iners TaxID=1073423 RepID=A0A1X7N082_9LACT|nr:flagellar basal-body MS-ring/collar protein FliF [Carnobacterium iners]SEK21765.1 flagellar M-ring protein FliF [Carnobacterium iners]SMH30618.1 flagellar M-ring protein FliF [Carnobacterium iners]